MGVLANGSFSVRGGLAEEPSVALLWSDYWEDPSHEHRNRLVEAYQGLVGEVVGRFAARLPRIVDRGDLDTAGNVGLIAAVGSFDPSRQVRFEAYGEKRIRGALLDELRSQDWFPRPWRQRMEKQKRAVERLHARLGRRPGDEEIARELDLTIEKYETLFGTALPGAPGGSMPFRADEDAPLTGLEVVPDPHGVPPAEKLTRDELLRLVAQKLTEQEYRIVYLRYWEELSMREIGELMDLSESRVWKIHLRLIERLKDRFRVNRIEKDEGTKRGSVPS
jgi:RNA polymerase sigma factor FliA